jgi:hypothetical protein
MLFLHTLYILISSTSLIIAIQQNAILASVVNVPWCQEGQPLLTDFQFLSVFTVCIIMAWIWLSLGPKPVAVNKHIHKDAAAKYFWYICLLVMLVSVTGSHVNTNSVVLGLRSEQGLTMIYWKSKHVALNRI